MPAAAVIPAPRVYIKAVAVKTLVVELLHPVKSLRKEGAIGDFGLWSFYSPKAPEKDNPMTNAILSLGSLIRSKNTPP